MPSVRVVLPQHLRTLAGCAGEEILLTVTGPVTSSRMLDALEEKYPALEGTIRDHHTRERRAFLRFFACQRDLSHDSPDAPLPEQVARGEEPLIILGAVAGG